MMGSVTLGNNIYEIISEADGIIFELGVLTQLSYEAFESSAKVIKDGSDEIYNLSYPIGQHPTGETMVGERSYKKEDLIAQYSHLAHNQLPLTSIYRLVTIMESMFADITRSIIVTYPKKLSGNRKLPLSAILECESLTSVHIAAANALLHELLYKSPKEFAESITQIININLLEIPSFHRYIEAKATRDIHIHNRGVVNETYISKAGPLARVKDGKFLPVTTNYFLSVYEACLQINESLIIEFNKTWPSSLYEENQQAKKIKALENK